MDILQRSHRRIPLFAMSLCMAISLSLGADIWVAPPPAGSDTTGNGTELTPYATVTKALQMIAVDNTTIKIKPGQYATLVQLSSLPGARNGLTILGMDPTGHTAQLRAGISLNAANDITGLTLQDLYLTNAGGEYIIKSAGTKAVNNFMMKNCVIDGLQQIAPKRLFGLKCTGYFGGTFIVDGCEWKDLMNWAVFENEGSGANKLLVTTFLFTNNHVHNVNGSLVWRGAQGALRTQTAEISHNIFEYLGNNYGEQGGQWAAWEISQCVNVLIYDNEIRGVFAQGIYTNEAQGFQLWDIDNLDMHDNDISKCNQSAVYFWGGPTGTEYPIPSGSIYNNNITGNVLAIELDPTTMLGGPLDVQNNWWGSSAGAGAGGNNGFSAGNIDGGNPLTSPNLRDDDGDGLYDWEEDTNGNGVYDPATDASNFQVADTDGDGVEDGIEVALGTDPKVAESFTDADNDGLPAALDPNDNNPDTDGDGFYDGYEYAAGTDPNSAASHPTLGDVNNNGRIDNVDAIIIFQTQLGALSINHFIVQVARMDLNRDGVVNYQDAVRAFDFFLGVITELP